MKKFVVMMLMVAVVLAVRTQFTWAATPSNASSSRSGRGGRGADVIVSEMAEHSEEADSTVGGEVHITVDGGEKRYDGTPVTASVSSTGLPAGYSLSYNLTGASRTEVGEQDINIHDLRVLDTDGNDVTERFALNVDLGTIRIWDDPAPTSPEVTEPETQPETVPETQPVTEPETTPETQPETQPVTEPETKPETIETTPAETIPETLSPDAPDGPVVDDRHVSHGSDSDDDSSDLTPTTKPEFHTPDLVEPLPNPDPDPDPVPPTEEETHEVHQMPKMGDASYQEAVAARSIAAALLGIAGLAGIMALLWGRRFFR